MASRTFKSAVDRFVKASPWLGDEHEPALMMLRAIAKELDAGNLSPAMLAQFGLASRSLAKLAPAAASEPADPLEAALAEAQG